MYDSDNATAESGTDFDVNEDAGERPDDADADGEVSAKLNGDVSDLLDKL